MFAIQVNHTVSFDANTAAILNRFIDLIEIDLVKLPKLTNDLKESNDLLESAVKQQEQLLSKETK